MLSEKYEWLSQAADNQQVTPEQLSVLLQQSELQSKLERYQLAGAVLRNEEESFLPADFSDHFASVLADEPVYQLQQQTGILQKIKTSLREAANAEWFKPAAHGAIAASVALVAVLGVQHYQQPFEQELAMPAPIFQTRAVDGFAIPVSLSQTSVESRFEAQEQQAIQEQQRRLQVLLQAHRQQVRVSEAQLTKSPEQEQHEH